MCHKAVSGTFRFPRPLQASIEWKPDPRKTEELSRNLYKFKDMFKKSVTEPSQNW